MTALARLATAPRSMTALAAAALAALAVGLVPVTGAQAATGHLPLGDPDLTETRSTVTLADGVTLTHIVRGTEPAPPDQINTTTRGPWVVNVLTINPSRAQGHLAATFGPDLAQTEKTTDLVRSAGALAGVNGSFFTFTASQQFPGDPVGLGLYGGRLLSEPTTDPTETDFVFNAVSDRVLTGPLHWSGTMINRLTGDMLPLEFIDHPPVVPAGCAALTDQTQCTQPGDLVEFTPEFAASTPSGPGVEVVLDRQGCVVRTLTSRGTQLAAGQTSLQATGQDTVSLLNATKQGCLRRQLSLTDQQGDELAVNQNVFGVNGRFRLVSGGQIVVPAGSGSFFDRNPRTIAGTTSDHKIILATIDGRSTASVGTTLAETAAVAQALGMSDAVNLDGGGSTAMSVEGALVNHPSDPGGERAVGDALVYIDHQ